MFFFCYVSIILCCHLLRFGVLLMFTGDVIMKLNIKKAMFTLLLASSLVLTRSNICANKDNYVESNYFKSTIDNVVLASIQDNYY